MDGFRRPWPAIAGIYHSAASALFAKQAAGLSPCSIIAEKMVLLGYGRRRLAYVQPLSECWKQALTVLPHPYASRSSSQLQTALLYRSARPSRGPTTCLRLSR